MRRVEPVSRALRELKRDPNAEEQKILDERPEVDPAMTIFLSAWDQLASERPIGDGYTGAIPWRAIRDWVQAEGLDDHWRRLLTEVIHEQDVKRAARISSEIELKRRRQTQ